MAMHHSTTLSTSYLGAASAFRRGPSTAALSLQTPRLLESARRDGGFDLRPQVEEERIVFSVEAGGVDPHENQPLYPGRLLDGEVESEACPHIRSPWRERRPPRPRRQ